MGVLLLISASASSIVAIAYSLAEQPPQAFAMFVGATTLTNLLAVAAVMAITVAVGKEARGTSQLWASAFLVIVAIFRSTERAPVLVLIVLGTILLASLRPRILPLWGILIVGLMLFGSDSLTAKFGLVLNGYALDRYTVWKAGIKLLSDVPLLG